MEYKDENHIVFDLKVLSNGERHTHIQKPEYFTSESFGRGFTNTNVI